MRGADFECRRRRGEPMKKKNPLRGAALLRAVRDHILAEPLCLRMARWVSMKNAKQLCVNPPTVYDRASEWNEPRIVKIPPCGTVACVAGWTALLGGDDVDNATVFAGQVATRFLGVNMVAARSLFYVSDWPEPHRSKYMKARTARARAEIAAARIDAFLVEHGKAMEA